MKKITFIMAVMLGIFMSSAQEHSKEYKERNQKEHRKSNPDGLKMRKAHMANFSPEQLATLQTKKMTLALDLTAAQQSKVQKLNEANAKLRQEKIKEFKAKKEDTQLSSEERYKRASSILDHKIAQKQEMKKILSEDQYDTWLKQNKGREHGAKKRIGKRGSETRQDRKSRHKE
ncbi:hypothetical protein MWU65_12140 [Cellulophaga sp. F20128]|uniref:hypothetical protein n=1 Tax=Cellulophaga sp. F20128 TaxID=2926413 RepID=UPI001FF163BD|nr:hypothetical protein [Cellulophaga sp. F20128]MCK0157937.1 hypothetical protein [Cellulophaga sp. F20128]